MESARKLPNFKSLDRYDNKQIAEVPTYEAQQDFIMHLGREPDIVVECVKQAALANARQGNQGASIGDEMLGLSHLLPRWGIRPRFRRRPRSH